MSFMTLGIFWVGQGTQLNLLARSNRNYSWLQLAFLLAVTLVPFSTGLLASFRPSGWPSSSTGSISCCWA